MPSYVYGDWPGPGTVRLIELADINPADAIRNGSHLKSGAKRKLMETIRTADIADLARAVAEKALPQVARYANPDPGPTRDLIRTLLDVSS